ncbi:hypothetical protein CONLIGDRAFT_465641 [Coniochaeta ligniaria NRRL 30616]|uniref:Uncharacterized protein n=1 Tax=Coniochaeta ligniaria NRRL 30616 TaxID=1408157 RepID=A0A1J7I3L3_9PEZI|nr:hypothetical protein CONLIGDRAFT_465641 [Coniochaeta ligniaria NRRL 30616]
MFITTRLDDYTPYLPREPQRHLQHQLYEPEYSNPSRQQYLHQPQPDVPNSSWPEPRQYFHQSRHQDHQSREPEYSFPSRHQPDCADPFRQETEQYFHQARHQNERFQPPRSSPAQPAHPYYLGLTRSSSALSLACASLPQRFSQHSLPSCCHHRPSVAIGLHLFGTVGKEASPQHVPRRRSSSPL